MRLTPAILDRWSTYFGLRDGGLGAELSAARAGLAPSSAYRYERGEPGCQGVRAALELGVDPPEPNSTAVAAEESPLLPVGAFPEFRLRYFGRTSMPWQAEAAEAVAHLLATKEREYVVMNEPPGSGKSTLFTHDVVCWLVARNRGIRVQIGSRTERQARMYVSRIKRTLERESPMLASPEAKEQGTAQDAVAAMSVDFGQFRPEGRSELWRADALVVKQDGQAADDKEPTVSAWGMDSGFLGGRFDLVVWDDLVDSKNTRSQESSDALRDWYFTEAESRLEPGGLLLLQGQRISPNDLYRTCLDQTDHKGGKKYRHIVYKAHDEVKCSAAHSPASPPWPDGCLLDPRRLPHHWLETIRSNNPRQYALMYQQEDGVGTGGLVERAWLEGGPGPDGTVHTGCYDARRKIKEPPPDHERMWSLVTVDPSPTEWWGVLRWLVDEDGTYWLMDIRRQRLRPDDWLGYDLDTRSWTGVMVDMLDDSVREGNPVTHCVVEINAAQRWLLSQPQVQRWQDQSRVQFLPHVTARNKLDPEYGVETLSGLFKSGKVRIPSGDPRSREEFKPLVDELLRYPGGSTDDLVMSTWFAKLGNERMNPGRRSAYRTATPLGASIRRGILR